MFKDLIARFPDSNDLLAYLKTPEGGSLKIVEKNPFAIVRYEKGTSDFKVSHVKLFRSVVWDIEHNCPISVTPFKSEEGESIPTNPTTEYSIETFMDGVLIGQFWNGTSWTIHTRTVLGGNCRYYSQKPFKTLFHEASPTGLSETLDKTVCYSWILQHPENRIVCDIRSPRIILVGANRIQTDGTVVPLSPSDLDSLKDYLPKQHSFPTWDAVRARLLEWNERYHHNFKGFAIREVSTGKRWKVRTESYNKVRMMRTNTPRLDFIWLSQWKAHTLQAYLRIYPEEKRQSDVVLHRLKAVTHELFQLYTAKFKARSVPEIPAKFRGILHSMHQHYYNVLKPAGKTLTFHEAVDWMNQRDIPQMLFLVNYELRPSTQDIPFESSAHAAPAEPAEAPAEPTEAPAEPAEAPAPPVEAPTPPVEAPAPPANAPAEPAEAPAPPANAPAASADAPAPPANAPAASADAPVVIAVE